MPSDAEVEAALKVLHHGAHAAWITLHPMKADEQRALVRKMLETVPPGDAEAVAASLLAAGSTDGIDAAIRIANAHIIEVNGDEWCECAEAIVACLEALKTSE